MGKTGKMNEMRRRRKVEDGLENSIMEKKKLDILHKKEVAASIGSIERG